MVRFERTRNDDSRTLHVHVHVRCLYASAFGTVLETLIVIKLRRLKSTRAGACTIQILQEVELEPAITQNQKDRENFTLNHKHNHSP